MPVDLTVAQKRLTALYNANAKNADGSMIYSTAVDDDRRNATELLDLVTEGAMSVLLALAESPSNGLRNQLMADSAEIVHRGRIPQHIGPIGVVKIQRFAGDSFSAGAKRPANEIESMRENLNNFYAPTAHDQQDEDGNPSPISGFWDILADELFYTGFSAKMQIANFTRADAATKVPDPYEDVVIAKAFALGVKDGDVSLTTLASNYSTYAEGALRMIRGGASVVPPIPEAQSQGA
jgi:hypothetical protein